MNREQLEREVQQLMDLTWVTPNEFPIGPHPVFERVDPTSVRTTIGDTPWMVVQSTRRIDLSDGRNEGDPIPELTVVFGARGMLDIQTAGKANVGYAEGYWQRGIDALWRHVGVACLDYLSQENRKAAVRYMLLAGPVDLTHTLPKQL